MQELPNDPKVESSKIVISKLQEMMSQKVFKPGDKLPSERELAKEFKVSRITIREALKVLNTVGITHTRKGSGTFVGIAEDNTINNKMNPLYLIAKVHNLSNEEVFQTRLLIEKLIAELAAQNATDENIADISDELVEMFYKSDSPDEYLAHSIKFHQKIAAATGNRLLIAIHNMLFPILKDYISPQSLAENNIKATTKSNQNIFRAIKNRNSLVAGQLMHEHLTSSRF